MRFVCEGLTVRGVSDWDIWGIEGVGVAVVAYLSEFAMVVSPKFFAVEWVGEFQRLVVGGILKKYISRRNPVVTS
jgi:hypothetical protein